MTQRPLLTWILAAIAGCSTKGEPFDGQACVQVAEDATGCPAAADVPAGDLFVTWDCDGTEVLSVSGAGSLVDVSTDSGADSDTIDLACCYAAVLRDPNENEDCVIGRPFREAGAAVVAALVGAGPEDDRARAWADAGLAEHASVAAFAKLALELMAHGAPADLLRDVFAAGQDEVSHADACFALAARFGGAPVVPGRFPFPGPVDPARSLADVAADAVREGCVGETVGAVLARAAAERADDPAICAIFATIAADEERHAVLSWRIVAWAWRTGDADVRAAVGAAFRAPAPGFDVAELARRTGASAQAFAEVVDGALADVVRPAARGVLAA